MISKALSKFIVFKDEILSIETLTGFLLLVWGLGVLNPYTHTFKSSIIFKPMADLGTEMLWGLIYVAFSLASFSFLYFRQRIPAQFLLMFAFIFISILFFYGNPNSYAGFIYLTCALGNFSKWFIEQLEGE